MKTGLVLEGGGMRGIYTAGILDAFMASSTDFYVTCTDLETGKAVNHLVKDLDGAVADSIPVLAFQEMGYQRNVVVLTREDGYVKKAEAPWLAKLAYRNYPKFVKALQNRHVMYNDSLAKLKKMEQEGTVLVIRPAASLNIGRLENNAEKIQEIYDIGYQDGLKVAEKVKEFLTTE